MSITVEFIGGERLRAKLAGLPDAVIQRILSDGIAAAALPVENDAKRYAPVLTGTLRRSIHTETRQSGRKAEAIVGTDVPYARRLEFGFIGADSRGRHYHQTPRPYLRPALDENRDQVKRIVGDVVTQAVAHEMGG